MSMGEILSSVPGPAVYTLIGLLIGVESIGVPVPGETALISAALLASHPGSLVSPWGIAGAAIAGAVIGDSIGYAVGRRLGARLLQWLSRRFPRRLSAAHLAYAEHLFARYGMVAVLGGRFIALLRMLAGPLAGALGMPYRRFVVANVTGAILWAGGVTFLIFTVGSAAQEWLEQGSWILLGVAVVMFVVAGFLLHRRFEERVRVFARHQAEAELGRHPHNPGPTTT